MHSRARGAYLVSFADAVVKPFIIIIIIEWFNSQNEMVETEISDIRPSLA